MLNCNVIYKNEISGSSIWPTEKKTNGTIGFLSSFRIRNMQLFQNFKMSKFDLFWPDLELDFDFFHKIKLNVIFAVIFKFYVEIGS